LKNFDCVCGTRVKVRGEGRPFYSAWRHRVLRMPCATNFPAKKFPTPAATYRAFKRECIENLNFFKGIAPLPADAVQIEGHTVTEIEVSNNPRFAARAITACGTGCSRRSTICSPSAG